MSKVAYSAAEAVSVVRDGSSLALGGFGVPGAPLHLMRALVGSSATDLELIANNGALFDWQLLALLEQGRVRRVVASHIGLNRPLVEAFLVGLVEVELVPQGTLVERLRAAGAGLPAFFTPTGAATMVEHGGIPWRYGSTGEVLVASQPKEARVIGGRRCILEEAIAPDVAFVHAWRGDAQGNLVYRRSARNFNPAWATAARYVIAEVEELVPVGTIDPDHVHTPGIWVDAVVEVGHDGKWFEVPVRPRESGAAAWWMSERHRIARRVAAEFRDGDYVNLGIGIPDLATLFVPPGMSVVLQCENGVIGLGDPPVKTMADFDLVNASKEPASVIPGGSITDSSGAFSVIRGGRLDLTVLGAMQVSAEGDLANWMVPGQAVAGMGGAMDLVVGAKRVVVASTHCDSKGQPKIVERCTFPLTGQRVVDRIITELAVIDVTRQGLVLRELSPGVSVERVLSLTGAKLLVPAEPGVMKGSSS